MSYFRFEADFVDTLRCIPMVVRNKLDVAGVKLKLAEWSRLDAGTKAALAAAPCATPAETDLWREAVCGAVASACGARPSLMPPADPIWESPEVPDQVKEKAKTLGLRIEDRQWAALPSLRRFALIKLSRPGHENRNFLPALEEFGLAPM